MSQLNTRQLDIINPDMFFKSGIQDTVNTLNRREALGSQERMNSLNALTSRQNAQTTLEAQKAMQRAGIEATRQDRSQEMMFRKREGEIEREYETEATRKANELTLMFRQWEMQQKNQMLTMLRDYRNSLNERDLNRARTINEELGPLRDLTKKVRGGFMRQLTRLMAQSYGLEETMHREMVDEITKDTTQIKEFLHEVQEAGRNAATSFTSTVFEDIPVMQRESEFKESVRGQFKAIREMDPEDLMRVSPLAPVPNLSVDDIAALRDMNDEARTRELAERAAGDQIRRFLLDKLGGTVKSVHESLPEESRANFSGGVADFEKQFGMVVDELRKLSPNATVDDFRTAMQSLEDEGKVHREAILLVGTFLREAQDQFLMKDDDEDATMYAAAIAGLGHGLFAILDEYEPQMIAEEDFFKEAEKRLDERGIGDRLRFGARDSLLRRLDEVGSQFDVESIDRMQELLAEGGIQSAEDAEELMQLADDMLLAMETEVKNREEEITDEATRDMMDFAPNLPNLEAPEELLELLRKK